MERSVALLTPSTSSAQLKDGYHHALFSYCIANKIKIVLSNNSIIIPSLFIKKQLYMFYFHICNNYTKEMKKRVN